MGQPIRIRSYCMCDVCVKLKKEQQKEPVSMSPSDAMKINKAIQLGKYDKVIIGSTAVGTKQEVIVDVYDVLRAFNVTDPALAHGIKKALCPGQRGSKGPKQDIDEAIKSLEKFKEVV